MPKKIDEQILSCLRPNPSFFYPVLVYLNSITKREPEIIPNAHTTDVKARSLQASSDDHALEVRSFVDGSS